MDGKWPLGRLAIIGAGGGAGYQLISFILNPLPPGIVEDGPRALRCHNPVEVSR